MFAAGIVGCAATGKSRGGCGPRVPGPGSTRLPNPIAPLARWKIFDNLRRTLMPMALTALLILGWTVVEGAARPWTWLAGAILFLPALLSALVALARKPKELPFRTHFNNVLSSTGQQLGQALLTLTFLPYEALVSLDAMLRTLGRLLSTGRNLLEWQTANDAEQQAATRLSGHCAVMWPAPMIAVFTAILVVVQKPDSWWLAFPILLLWLLAPVVAWWISRPLPQEYAPLPPRQIEALRLTARKTWRYFETFVNERENWLPPDNFQEFPSPVVAARTSPTNIGLGMLSALAARDFGYLTLRQMTAQLRRARFASGLSVVDFMKRTTFLDCGPQGLAAIGPAGAAIADVEGLAAHAASIRLRLA